MGKEPLNTTCTPAMRENTNDCSWPIRDCCEGLLATLNRQSLRENSATRLSSITWAWQ